MATENRFSVGFARHPGHILNRELSALNMSQAELSIRTGTSTKYISQIINGSASISPDMAYKLELVLGTPAHVWIGLQSNYEEAVVRERELHAKEQEIDIAKQFNYSSISKLFNNLPKVKNMEEQVYELKRFFGVSDLSLIFNADSARSYHAAALRTGSENAKKAPDEYALAAWLRTGELYAANVLCGVFDPKGLKAALPQIKRIINTEPINIAWQQIRKLLLDCGVKLVAVPYLSKTYVNGAVRWIGDNPVIIMSDRNAYADIFWFSLLHEICHVLKHGKKYACVAFESSIKCYERRKEEDEADSFAANFFIKEELFDSFSNSADCWNSTCIYSFAEQQGVPYYMVVGRLCHKKNEGWNRPIATGRPKVKILTA